MNSYFNFIINWEYEIWYNIIWMPRTDLSVIIDFKVINNESN